MITFETAKLLKERGFPQYVPGETKQAYDEKGTVIEFVEGDKEWKSPCYVIPSSRELVLALGDDIDDVLYQAWLTLRDQQDAGDKNPDPFRKI